MDFILLKIRSLLIVVHQEHVCFLHKRFLEEKLITVVVCNMYYLKSTEYLIVCGLQEDETLKSLMLQVHDLASCFPGSFTHTFCHSSEFLISL